MPDNCNRWGAPSAPAGQLLVLPVQPMPVEHLPERVQVEVFEVTWGCGGCFDDVHDDGACCLVRHDDDDTGSCAAVSALASLRLSESTAPAQLSWNKMNPMNGYWSAAPGWQFYGQYLGVYLTQWGVCHHNVLLVLLAGHCSLWSCCCWLTVPLCTVHIAVAVLLWPCTPSPRPVCSLDVHTLGPWDVKTCQDLDWRLSSWH